MRIFRILTTEERAKIANKYKCLKIQIVAKKLGYNPKTVRNVVRGIKPKKIGRPKVLKVREIRCMK